MQGGAGTLVAGRYLLAEAVGQGGMGRVWRGHDQLLDRVVAVKEVIVPARSPDERGDLVARTMREARAAARLDHPGVITIHDVVEDDGSPWIVMQFVAGTSLGSRIDDEGRLSWQEVADIGEQVAEALTVAHAAGIVHRDLKPDNILLSGSRAIVTDFGIARIMDSATQPTGTGILAGTPAYMAPEQLDGGGAGPAADLWALGATLYTAVEGAPPFAGATMAALIAAIVTKAPPRPQHAGAALGDVVARLMARDPAQRPDAPAAARALAACRAAKAAPGPAAGLQPSPTAAGEGPGSPRPPAAGSGVATATTPAPIAASHPNFPPMQQPPAPRPEPALIPQPLGRVAPARQRRWRLTVGILSAAAVLATLAGAGAALLSSGIQSAGTASSSTRAPISRSARTSAPTGPVTTSLLATLTDPHGKSVDSVAFGPGGTLAAGDANGSTYLWSTTTRSVIDTFTDPNGGKGVGPVAFGPDGTLAAGDFNGSTYLWNTTIKSVIDTFIDPGGQGVSSVAFGPDGTLATGDENGSTYLWNTTTISSSPIATLPTPHGGRPADVAFEPDGALAVADFIQVGSAVDARYSGSTYLWNTTTKSIVATLPAPHGTAPIRLALASDGTLATGDENGNTYLWNTDTRTVTATLSAPRGEYPTGVAFGPDGILAVADTACTGACLGGAVPGGTYLWDTATRSVVATLPAPQGEPPYSVAFGPDGTLAIGDANGSTYLWRISRGKS